MKEEYYIVYKEFNGDLCISKYSLENALKKVRRPFFKTVEWFILEYDKKGQYRIVDSSHYRDRKNKEDKIDKIASIVLPFLGWLFLIICIAIFVFSIYYFLIKG